MSKTFAISTLGCKVNQEEGYSLSNILNSHGYRQVEFNEIADIYIINTCTVTHLADKKSRQMIRRAIKTNAQALIAVTGCYAQTSAAEIAALSGVDLIIGNNDRANIFNLLEAKLAGQGELIAVSDIMQSKVFQTMPVHHRKQERARAFLKIEDGCGEFCNYCIIPYARGPVRSMPFEQVLTEAQALLDAGHKEIVLTGIHIGAYGHDLAQPINIAAVIQALASLPGLYRLRLGSLEPQHVTEELLDVIAGCANVCHHLHIPLQTGDDQVLVAMGRKYTTAEYAQVLALARAKLDHVAITTDVMVGYPGETDEQFANTCQFIQKSGLADIHVFPYSIRKGTVAGELQNQTDNAVKDLRSKVLVAIAADLHQQFMQNYVGKKVQVLLEQKKSMNDQDYWLCHSDNYLPALVQDHSYSKGQLLTVNISAISDGKLLG